MNDFRCSRYLWFFTIFMVGFPPFYLLFASFIFELSSKGIVSIVLSPLFYLSSFFWVMTGIGIRKMNQWSWYTLGAAQIFVTYLNALTLVNHSESQFKLALFLSTLFMQIFIYNEIGSEIRVPFLFPKIRWWESGLAGMYHLPVEIFHSRSATGVSTGQMLDVSARGCFIKSPLDYEPLEKIKLRLEGYGHEVDISGLIVWSAKSTVTHPKGIGVRFFDIDRTGRRKIKVISKRFLREKEKMHAALKISV